MPRLAIGKYITSEDNCIIPSEFTISFDNVERDRFEGVFSKYRILYVDYDVNRLSVRLNVENKFIPAAAAEIEKLMDYAHLLEEGDLEICEPSGLSPEEFIAGVKRSIPSLRSHPEFKRPASGIFSKEPAEYIQAESDPGADTIETDFNEISSGIIGEETVPVELIEEFIPDYAEIPTEESPGPEESVSFDDLDDMDLDLLPEGDELIPEFEDSVSNDVLESEESVSFDDPDDINLDLLPEGDELIPEFEDSVSNDVLESEESISFDDLDDMDLDLLPETDNAASESEGLSFEELNVPSGAEETDDLLSAGDFSGLEGFEDEFNLEEEDLSNLAGLETGSNDPVAGTGEEAVSGLESSGFEVTDEFSDLEELVEESSVDTMLLEAEELVSEGKYEDAVNVLDRSVLEKSGSADLWIRRGDVCALARQIPEALESYEKAVEIDPDNRAAFLSMIHLLKENDKYEDAAGLLDSCIKKNPGDSHLWFEKGWIKEKSGDYEEALLDYDQAMSLDSGCTKAITCKALLLMREKRPEEALECYDLLIQRRPGNAAVLHSRGLVLKVLGRFDDAIASFEEAVSLDPTDVDTLLEIAILLLETGRYEDALENYKKLLGAGISGSEILSGQGDAYMALGMIEEAMAAYESAIESGGNILGALKGKAEILAASGRIAEAEESYKIVLEMNPLDTDALQKLASLYEKADRPRQALYACEKILIANPGDPSALNGRIRNLVALGRYSEAIPLYDSLIITNPKSYDLISGKAFSLARTGRKDEAIVLYVSALELEPENTDCLLELVALLSDLERYGECLPYYDRLISLVPEEAGFVMSKALALYALGRFEEAVAGFEEVLRKHPGDTEALLNMGTALFRLGERRGAMECYKKSIDIDPAFGKEWSKRGINASSFIEWELDRIQKASESSSRSGQQPERHNPGTKEKKVEVMPGTAEIPASGIDSMDYDVVNVSNIRMPTKAQLDDPDYLYKKGLALARKGYFRAALKCFGRIESLTEDCSEAVFSRGIIYAKNGYYTEAVECFDRVLTINPSHEKAQKAKKMSETKKKE